MFVTLVLALSLSARGYQVDRSHLDLDLNLNLNSNDTSAGIDTTSKSDKSCSELGWEAHQKHGVCAASFMKQVNPPCAPMMNFTTANDYCVGRGARLCTAADLGSDVAKGTGCALDDKFVWSSSSCPDGIFCPLPHTHKVFEFIFLLRE